MGCVRFSLLVVASGFRWQPASDVITEARDLASLVPWQNHEAVWLDLGPSYLLSNLDRRCYRPQCARDHSVHSTRSKICHCERNSGSRETLVG